MPSLIGLSGTLLALAVAPVVPAAAADDRGGGDSEPKPIITGDSEPHPIIITSDDRGGGDSEPKPIVIT
jgi:hypothetical protein